MNTHQGINALSDFRAQGLLKQLQAIDKNVRSVSAEFVHFTDVVADKTLLKAAQMKLEKLLTYGSSFGGARSGELFLVTPRPGTISPWSSKATDIARSTGLGSVVRRIERGTAYYIESSAKLDRAATAALLHDRMTEVVFDTLEDGSKLFEELPPKPLITVDVLKGGKTALEKANAEQGLALSPDEINYLVSAYLELGRNPSDAELMMFGQVNSEHCRHKIFNADWVIDGQRQPKSLFKMIKNTFEKGGGDVLSAYSDNAAVLAGPTAGRFFADPESHEYTYYNEPIHTVIKVETHNHPTAIAPFPGAATGTGGEIRDEGATGRGAKPKMGLTGFTVSNLHIPGYIQPWERPYGKPDRITSPLDIMIDAPLGGAAFANEFGRPNLAGYFRTYESDAQRSVAERWGYHKPIMIAGGLGNIREQHVKKGALQPGDKIVILGGPAMLIGLGGGAASSMQTGTSSADLDFASVQRGNGEMERRCQEVIDACWADDDNPIVMIHDIGAGGYCNAVPELVHDAGLGADIDLRAVDNAEPGMSPMEIWCNEAQERYVIGLRKADLPRLATICARERCPFAVIGTALAEDRLVVRDRLLGNNTVDLPMSTLFGKPPKMTRTFKRVTTKTTDFDTSGIDVADAAKRVLHMPSVGSKKFLITIGDRTVTGLIARDQMVGPWQVPVADVAVSAVSFDSNHGEAMTMGERTPLAVTSAPASGRMAIGEVITNIMAADVEKLSDIKLSANWMAAAGQGDEDQALYDTVHTVGEEFCPALGLTIPVGKDSLSMRTVWQDKGEVKSVVSPVSLIITGFSPVTDVTKTLTPQLALQPDSRLIFVDLSGGTQRLGGSALAQAYNQASGLVPDADAAIISQVFTAFTKLKRQGKILAYHDRSDGGLFAVLAEMAFAGRCGFDIDIAPLGGSNISALFNEELGFVIQVRASDAEAIVAALGRATNGHAYVLGKPRKSQTLTFRRGQEIVYENTRAKLESWWAETSYRIQSLRDNPACADEEFAAITDTANLGLTPKVVHEGAPATERAHRASGEQSEPGEWRLLSSAARRVPQEGRAPLEKEKRAEMKPRVAIFREQGVNGHIEMAAAFDRAGFTSIDVHLEDIIAGTCQLDEFSGLVACGGFSYGDVLGAGEGWAKTILFDPKLRSTFQAFFARKDTFSLGVCNGCQMLSALKELIPGTETWPVFLRNTSEQFEARVVLTKVNNTPSIFFTGMADAVLPIPVAHGEGYAAFKDEAAQRAALASGLVAAQYVDSRHEVTEAYPANPNGSPDGITALTTPDGRATIMMPHPERAFMTRQLSWHPDDWGENSPWMQMFINARQWVEANRN